MTEAGNSAPRRILFLCTGNSCRSQMAEGFARGLGGGLFEVYSAGTHPQQLNPRAVEVMRERGIDISSQFSKGLSHVPNEMDIVVTVCDQAAEACPLFPGGTKVIHWSLPDPASAQGTPEDVMIAFRSVRDEIEARVRALVEEVRDASR